jgi:hypothetical protein
LRHLARLLTITLVLVGVVPAGAETPAPWLFTSDIHLNPFDDPALADKLADMPIEQWDEIFDADPQPPSPYLSDTNPALFRTALAAMKAQVPNPAVVVIPGDFLAHTFHTKWSRAIKLPKHADDFAFYAFAAKTIAYLAHEFDQTFPSAQFVITLGNNDSAYGDFDIQPNSPFLDAFAKAWEPLVDRNGRAPDFAVDAPIDGNYVTTLPNGTHVVVVNSNVWSPEAKSFDQSDGTASHAALDGMTWFEKAVAASPKGARTWAVMHVPPGIDAFSSLRSGTPEAFYSPALLARFRAVRAADGMPLGLIVAGHIHNDGFRIVDQTPLIFVPSISPNHANNPSFEVVHVDATTGGIADYAVYAFAEKQFMLEYSFNSRYGLHGFSVASLTTLQQHLASDPALRAAEASYYVSGSPMTPITATNWRTFWCANQTLDPMGFHTCLTP